MGVHKAFQILADLTSQGVYQPRIETDTIWNAVAELESQMGDEKLVLLIDVSATYRNLLANIWGESFLHSGLCNRLRTKEEALVYVAKTWTTSVRDSVEPLLDFVECIVLIWDGDKIPVAKLGERMKRDSRLHRNTTSVDKKYRDLCRQTTNIARKNAPLANLPRYRPDIVIPAHSWSFYSDASVALGSQWKNWMRMSARVVDLRKVRDQAISSWAESETIVMIANTIQEVSSLVIGGKCHIIHFVAESEADVAIPQISKLVKNAKYFPVALSSDSDLLFHLDTMALVRPGSVGRGHSLRRFVQVHVLDEVMEAFGAISRGTLTILPGLVGCDYTDGVKNLGIKWLMQSHILQIPFTDVQTLLDLAITRLPSRFTLTDPLKQEILRAVLVFATSNHAEVLDHIPVNQISYGRDISKLSVMPLPQVSATFVEHVLSSHQRRPRRSGISKAILAPDWQEPKFKVQARLGGARQRTSAVSGLPAFAVASTSRAAIYAAENTDEQPSRDPLQLNPNQQLNRLFNTKAVRRCLGQAIRLEKIESGQYADARMALMTILQLITTVHICIANRSCALVDSVIRTICIDLKWWERSSHLLAPDKIRALIHTSFHLSQSDDDATISQDSMHGEGLADLGYLDIEIAMIKQDFRVSRLLQRYKVPPVLWWCWRQQILKEGNLTMTRGMVPVSILGATADRVNVNFRTNFAQTFLAQLKKCIAIDLRTDFQLERLSHDKIHFNRILEYVATFILNWNGALWEQIQVTIVADGLLDTFTAHLSINLAHYISIEGQWRKAYAPEVSNPFECLQEKPQRHHLLLRWITWKTESAEVRAASAEISNTFKKYQFFPVPSGLFMQIDSHSFITIIMNAQQIASQFRRWMLLSFKPLFHKAEQYLTRRQESRVEILATNAKIFDNFENFHLDTSFTRGLGSLYKLLTVWKAEWRLQELTNLTRLNNAEFWGLFFDLEPVHYQVTSNGRRRPARVAGSSIMTDGVTLIQRYHDLNSGKRHALRGNKIDDLLGAFSELEQLDRNRIYTADEAKTLNFLPRIETWWQNNHGNYQSLRGRQRVCNPILIGLDQGEKFPAVFGVQFPISDSLNPHFDGKACHRTLGYKQARLDSLTKNLQQNMSHIADIAPFDVATIRETASAFGRLQEDGHVLNSSQSALIQLAPILSCMHSSCQSLRRLIFNAANIRTSELDQMCNILFEFCKTAQGGQTAPIVFGIGDSFDSQRTGARGVIWSNVLLERFIQQAKLRMPEIQFVKVSEYNTSKRCCVPSCNAPLEYPNTESTGSSVFRLLHCKECGNVYHRDKIGALNIIRMMESELRGVPSPLIPL